MKGAMQKYLKFVLNFAARDLQVTQKSTFKKLGLDKISYNA